MLIHDTIILNCVNLKKSNQMKKLFLFLMLGSFACFTSCNQPQKTVTTVTTTTVTPIEPTNGFYVKSQVVFKGNTVWGISQKIYGTGFRWREIVAQNPFLSAPGRVYYNDSKKMWIVIIYPGEVLKIGGEVITPNYIVEVTKTTTTTNEKPAIMPVAPLWMWLLALIVAGIVVMIVLLIRSNISNNSNNSSTTSNSNSSSAVHVDIHNGGIDLATRATLLGREQDFQDNALRILANSSEKNQLSKFSIDKVDNQLIMKAKFFNHSEEEKPVNIPPLSAQVEEKEERE